MVSTMTIKHLLLELSPAKTLSYTPMQLAHHYCNCCRITHCYMILLLFMIIIVLFESAIVLTQSFHYIRLHVINIKLNSPEIN